MSANSTTLPIRKPFMPRAWLAAVAALLAIALAVGLMVTLDRTVSSPVAKPQTAPATFDGPGSVPRHWLPAREGGIGDPPTSRLAQPPLGTLIGKPAEAPRVGTDDGNGYGVPVTNDGGRYCGQCR